MSSRRQQVYGRPTTTPDPVVAAAARGDRKLQAVAYVEGRRDGFDMHRLDRLAADVAEHWTSRRRRAAPADSVASTGEH